MSRFVKSALFVMVVLAAVPAQAALVQVLQNGDFETTSCGNGTNNGLALGNTAAMPNWYLECADPTVSNYSSVDKNAGDKPAYTGAVCMSLPGGGIRYIYQTFGVTAGTTYTVSYWARALASGDCNNTTNPYLSTTLAVDTGTVTGTGVDSGSGTNTVTETTPHFLYSSSNWVYMNNNGGIASYATGGSAPSTTYAQYSFTFTPSSSANANLQFYPQGVPQIFYSSLTLTSQPYHFLTDQTDPVAIYCNLGGNGMLLDNVSVSYDNAVPEPGTLALLAAGLAGLLCYAWRRRR